MRLLPWLLLPLLLAAQDRRPGPALAIRGARVWTDAATVHEIATIVIRDGLVVAVGGDVIPPPDAEILEARDLHVYPGFLDALGATGLGDTKRSPEEVRRAEATATDFKRDSLGGMEPANRKGIRPEFQAVDRFQLSPEDLERLHRGGYTAFHAGCANELLGGSTALFAVNGGTRRESLLRAGPAQVASFSTYGDGYPSTPMGTMAQFRQVFLDARRLRELRAAWEARPDGRPRPPTDPSLEAIVPVLDGKVPLWFAADTVREIDRVLDLAREFSLKVVVTGGREAGLAADRLKAAGVPVVLSLKFPKEPKRPRKPAPPKPPAEGEDETYEERIKPREQYEEERREWELRVGGAIALRAAGVPFVFSGAGLKEPAETLKSVATLVEKGLPAAAAVEALTSRPAALLGQERTLGTIAPGRPANLVLLSAPLGDRQAVVRHVVAEGRKFTYKSDAKLEAPPEMDLSGSWTIKAEKSDAGPLEFVLELAQKGRDLSGVARGGPLDGAKSSVGSAGGKAFRLALVGKVDGERVDAEFRGEWADGALSGTASGPFGDDVKWTGKRTP